MIAGMLDEISDKATSLIKSGQARTPEEATDLAIRICCSGGHCDGQGLGGFLTDAWNALTGKPQSWYTNVSRIQNQLSVLLAGVTAVGQDAWNNTADGTTDYNQVTSDIQAALTSIIVTTSHVPDDGTIAAAQATASQYQSQLDLVQAATPEVVAQVQADQAQVQSMLPSAMTSPSAVGQAVFEQELADRAKALGQGVSDIVKYLAYAAGGILGIYALSKMGGSRAA
jgi:hypothetical protein